MRNENAAGLNKKKKRPFRADQ